MQKGFVESNLKYEVVSGGTHSEGAWAAQFQRVYEFLFEKVFTDNKEIFENDLSEQIELNTSSNQLLINNKNNETVDFRLYNTNGALVKAMNLTPGTHQISLPKGSYIAEYSNNIQKESKKLVIY